MNEVKRTRILVAAACTALSASRCAHQPAPEPSPSEPARATLPAPVPSAVPPVEHGEPTAAIEPPAGDGAQRWSFDSDPEDGSPPGFSFGLTGSGPPGRWVVRAEPDAPSRPNVLAQLDADDTDFRFPVAVADAPALADLRLSARCKMVSGRVDQACGLVFRYRDASNYFITRANALESNIRLYTVKDGGRRQLASWSGPVTAGTWHEYAVEIRGDHMQVFWDGTQVLDHHDATFSDAGKVGVWTKADGVTYFDDLSVAQLGAGGGR